MGLLTRAASHARGGRPGVWLHSPDLEARVGYAGAGGSASRTSTWRLGHTNAGGLESKRVHFKSMVCFCALEKPLLSQGAMVKPTVGPHCGSKLGRGREDACVVKF